MSKPVYIHTHTYTQHRVTLIFRVSTGENWQDVMVSTLPHPDDCDPRVLNISNKTVCGSEVSYLFFPLFYFLSTVLVSCQLQWTNLSTVDTTGVSSLERCPYFRG